MWVFVLEAMENDQSRTRTPWVSIQREKKEGNRPPTDMSRESFRSTLLNHSARWNEMMGVIGGDLLMSVRGYKDVEVLSFPFLREIIRLTSENRDERSTKSNVEGRIDNLNTMGTLSKRSRSFLDTHRIQIGRDVSKPTGKIQQRCLDPAWSTDSGENVQYRERKPCHEKNEEDNTENFHCPTFTSRFISTLESVDRFFH